MDAATARARLERMVGHDQDPALTSAEVDDLVVLAKRNDAYGLEPDDASWVPTYDLNAAAAEGWRWKAAKVASRVDVTEGGDSLRRRQTYDACMEMARSYEARVLGSVRLSTAAGAAVWPPVIGNLD